MLSGHLPPELGKLRNLQYLILWGLPALTGPIPPEYGNLVNLKHFWLTNNNLTGSIPPELELGNLESAGQFIIEIQPTPAPEESRRTACCS